MSKFNSLVGGEYAVNLELLDYHGREFKPIAEHNQMYASGRTALYAVLLNLNEKGYKHLLIPDFMCGSMFLSINSSGMNYKFYHVGKDLFPDFVSFEIEDDTAILLINYFGLIDLTQTISRLRNLNKNLIIIIDDVQAFYSNDYRMADYTFISLRKWFPVPDGAFVFCNDNRIEQLHRFDGHNNFAKYKFAGNILKNFADIICDDIALELIKKGEQILDLDYKVEASGISNRIMSNLLLKDIADRRRDNGNYLHEKLSEWNIPHIYKEGCVPLFIPIFISNRDIVRKRMFENGLFCPVHWPLPDELIEKHNNLYDTELSLICDQRYGKSEMDRQLEIINDECKIV